MEKDLSLSLRSEFFDAAIQQFDNGLTGAISDAEKKQMDIIKFSFNGELALEKADVTDKDVYAYPATREIIKPLIKFKTEFVLQQKTSDTGKLRSDCELVWDAEHKRYLVRVEDDGQTTLFHPDEDGITYSVDQRGTVTVDAEYEEIDTNHMLSEPPRQLSSHEDERDD